MKYIIPLLLCILLSSCAHTSQKLKTADGDEYATNGTALFSKTKVIADGNLVIYPNNSGLEFTVGTQSDLDSEASIALIKSLLTIMSLPGASGLLTPPSTQPTSPLAPAVPTMREFVRELVQDEIRNRITLPIPGDK